MTYLAKDIADHLKGSANIVNVVSDRIFPGAVPQELRTSTGIRRDCYPCLVINDLTSEPEYALSGEIGTHISQVQVDAWTDGTGGLQAANELGELVRNRLSGYRGTFGTGCFGTSRLIRYNSLSAPPVDGSDQHRRRVSMDFEVIHTAAVPSLT